MFCLYASDFQSQENLSYFLAAIGKASFSPQLSDYFPLISESNFQFIDP